MHRRELLKGVAAAGALAIAPQLLSANSSRFLPIHFIGLGGAGCNVLEAFYAKEKEHRFTCITDERRTHWPNNFQFIPFQRPANLSRSTAEYLLDKNLSISMTPEMEILFSQQHHFILLTGLGGYTGTKLLQAIVSYLHAKKNPLPL